MLHYIIQTVAFQLFFLIIYDVFLKDETFFNWNRVYLLATALISLIIPFIKIEGFKKVVPQDYIVALPEIVLGQLANNTNMPAQLDAANINNDISLWALVFYIGAALALLVFLYKMARISILIFKNPKTYSGKLTLINLLKSNSAFSFFRYVFLGELLKNEEKETILKHEIIHVKQLHSVDLLYFEILRILFWFNPLVYMYQNRITTLHEFIADAEAVKHENKSQYYQKLLSQVFDTQKISFINTFFKQSLIKKRIVMLQKSKSKQVKLLKYALLIPLVLGMLVYSSCEKENETNQTDALDLSQYSYSLKVGEKEMSEENQAIHDKYEAFLKANPDYVSWAVFDEETKTASYSVHSKNEKVPEEYRSPGSRVVNSLEGESYKIVFLYTMNNSQESEEQKADKLLKLKEEYKNAIEVPFAYIEQVPIFPGCEGMPIDEQKKCISQKITEHVGKNFNTNIAKVNNLTGRQRINVIFKINEEGDVVGVQSRAPHPALEEEAIRVINTLPKFKPGINNGKTVSVPYSLPIVFQVIDDKAND